MEVSLAQTTDPSTVLRHKVAPETDVATKNECVLKSLTNALKVYISQHRQ